MFGYTKEISPHSCEKNKDYYNPGDYIGYTGIEKTYEKYLRGEKGYNYILVDSRRREIGKFKDGADDVSFNKREMILYFQLMRMFREAAEEALKGLRGACVAIDPTTGEVLAMVSSPEYDLNEFSYVTSSEYLNKLYNDQDKPLFNRATMSDEIAGINI